MPFMGVRSKYFDPRSIRTSARTEKGDLWHKVLPWAYLSVFIGALVLVGAIFWPVFKRNQDMIVQRSAIQKSIEEQQALSLILQDELYALQDDPYYIERTARDVLNMGKNGEVIFRFLPYESNKLSP